MNFKNEKEFQIALARTLKEIGFEVYLDKNVCEDIPSFKGDREKPDILVFFKKNYYHNKTIDISQPIAIETKDTINQKFNSLSKGILQIKKYFGKKYTAGEWSGEIKNIVLATPHSILKEYCYDWSLASEDFNRGIDWALNRILFSISNNSGILKKDNKDNFYIEFHNSKLFLLKGGDIGYKPSRWNNLEKF